MDYLFPEVFELEEQISFTIAHAVSRVELGVCNPWTGKWTRTVEWTMEWTVEWTIFKSV